jgi:hypothetical protein
MNGREFTIDLLMRGSLDGFRANRFHQLCDHKGPTLSIVESHLGFRGGGYTAMPWDKSHEPEFKKE